MTDHFSPLTNHLWQSTLFTALVAIVALALRNNHAKTHYWLWLAASLKFLIPFSLLVSLGTRVDVPAVAPMMPALAVEQITTSFAPVSPIPKAATQSSTPWWPKFAAAVWLLGAIILLTRWFRRWLVIRKALQAATPLPLAAPIPVLSSRTTIEPGVFGILRPVLLLPEGITINLSAEELDAILAHELSHVQRRDNLTAALHMRLRRCSGSIRWSGGSAPNSWMRASALATKPCWIKAANRMSTRKEFSTFASSISSHPCPVPLE